MTRKAVPKNWVIVNGLGERGTVGFYTYGEAFNAKPVGSTVEYVPGGVATDAETV